VDVTGDPAGVCAGVLGRYVAVDRAKHIGVDFDLHLLGSICRPLVEQRQVGLHLVHVIGSEGKVFALVDVQLNGRAFRGLVAEIHALLVVVDGDARTGANDHLVTVAGDFTFVVGVCNGRQHGRVVKLLDQLARPDFRDKPGAGRNAALGSVAVVRTAINRQTHDDYLSGIK